MARPALAMDVTYLTRTCSCGFAPTIVVAGNHGSAYACDCTSSGGHRRPLGEAISRVYTLARDLPAGASGHGQPQAGSGSGSRHARHPTPRGNDLGAALEARVRGGDRGLRPLRREACDHRQHREARSHCEDPGAPGEDGRESIPTRVAARRTSTAEPGGWFEFPIRPAACKRDRHADQVSGGAARQRIHQARGGGDPSRSAHEQRGRTRHRVQHRVGGELWRRPLEAHRLRRPRVRVRPRRRGAAAQQCGLRGAQPGSGRCDEPRTYGHCHAADQGPSERVRRRRRHEPAGLQGRVGHSLRGRDPGRQHRPVPRGPRVRRDLRRSRELLHRDRLRQGPPDRLQAAGGAGPVFDQDAPMPSRRGATADPCPPRCRRGSAARSP